MGITNLLFTCSDCRMTYNGPIEHGGSDGDEARALQRITGRRRENGPKGPICPDCLEKWIRDLKDEHFTACLNAAKFFETRTNARAAVFTPHLRGPDLNKQGTWISSSEHFQTIPAEAKTLTPERSAWKRKA